MSFLFFLFRSESEVFFLLSIPLSIIFFGYLLSFPPRLAKRSSTQLHTRVIASFSSPLERKERKREKEATARD